MWLEHLLSREPFKAPDYQSALPVGHVIVRTFRKKRPVTQGQCPEEIIDIIGKKEDTREEKEHEKVKKSARGMPVAPRGEEGRDKLRKAAGRRK